METTQPDVQIKAENSLAIFPAYAHETDSGADLFTPVDFILHPGDIEIIDLCFKIALPPGYEAQVRSKSGLATRGVHVLNSPGTIDNDYRGSIKVILKNSSVDHTNVFNRGDKIAQIVFAPVVQAAFVKVATLTETERGEGGLGSTGK